ncbi:unnamed protein product [Fusarium venenatum]|uniref:Uncharacterized protein n=1 Tax=Fusarium venenatum TaxID=56646 RepID=A0A2L2TI97_9HYPO|nr:uncharacterized protein FVRRES_07192 [Fusarium venenatum]CEI62756.1 unnamed protein product [Fusarium venenatum]
MACQHSGWRLRSLTTRRRHWCCFRRRFTLSPERWIISRHERAELESRELPSPEANTIEADTESLARSTAPASKDQSFAKEYDLHVRDSWIPHT